MSSMLTAHGTAGIALEGDWRRALARSRHVPAPAGAIAGRVWKELREVAAVTEWAAVMGEHHGLRIGDIRSHPRQAAPDCLFRMRGTEYTAEVTELIDEDLARFLSVRARDGRMPSFAPPSLHRDYWDRDTFREKLAHRIARKRAVATSHERRIDALIVTTYEPLLTPDKVADWLEGWPLEPTRYMRSGWLMMETDPTFAPHQPVFPLFGDFPPPRPPRRFFFF